MGTLINYLRRNNHTYSDYITSSHLKPIVNKSVLSKSIMYSYLSSFESNKYLNDSVIDTYLLIRNLSSLSNFWHLNPEGPSLPDDIIRLEILTRLPVKSLIRFRCVCKLWQSFISNGDPDFIKSHLASISSDPNNDFVITEYRSCDRDKKLTQHVAKSMSISGSVNGLVCLYYYNWYKFSVVCFGMWNPATSLYKDIPSPSSASYARLGSFSVGFGFDEIINDYKIIFVTRLPNQPLVADIYSCNTGSWSDINVTSNIISCGMFNEKAVVVRGSLFWRNYDRPDGEEIVISFDISHEAFRLLPNTPTLHDRSHQFATLTNVMGSLAFIVYHQVSTTPVDVYIFDETISSACGGGWNKKYTVGPNILRSSMWFLECFKNGDLLFKNDEQFKFVAINPDTQEIEKLDTDFHPNVRWELYCSYFHVYTETLVSVKGMNQIKINEEAPEIVSIQR